MLNIGDLIQLNFGREIHGYSEINWNKYKKSKKDILFVSMDYTLPDKSYVLLLETNIDKIYNVSKVLYRL